MFTNYFKSAWRNLVKNKFYSLINIAGLSAGLAVGVLILLWVQDEWQFDMFNTQARQIYRLENQVGTGSSIQIWSVTNAPIATRAKAELPEVENAVRISYNGFFTAFSYGGKIFSESKTFFADPSFFSIFSFPLIAGNRNKPFPNDHSIVITSSTAKRYFGDQDPIGKIILADHSIGFEVSGVIQDFPKNSSIIADLLFPMQLANKKLHLDRGDKQTIEDDWEQFNYTTYLLLRPGSSIPALAKKLRDIHLRFEPKDTDIQFLIQPLSKMHLFRADGSNAGIETVRIFIIVAILILVIACINYVNLSTARATLRAKEVSLRKIIGAGRMQLFSQFILESALLFIIASVLALSLIYLLMPAFNKLSGKEINFDLANPQVWMVIGFSITGTLLASCIYPAMLLTSFSPINALKGKISKRVGEGAFRKAMVVTQFAISVSLIAGTLVIGKQLNFIHSKALGYDKSQVLTFMMPNVIAHYDGVKAALMESPAISGVTRSSENIISLGSQTGDNDWNGKLPNQTFMIYPVSVDKNFIPFFKLQLTEGKNFTDAIADSNHVILNETAVKEAGIINPIGKRFRLYKHNATIIGVVKDFHFASLKKKIEPAALYFDPSYGVLLHVKTNPKDASKAIAAAEKVWNQNIPGYPFSYHFLDEDFENLYRSEERTSSLFSIFAGIAILISCMGLLGLTSYTSQVRTREIGVRKVLGASVSNIVRLLAGDFIRLVCLGIFIAIPVSWFAMKNWLMDFAYRINLGWTIFAIAGFLAIFIALFTISFQSIRAALANPIKSLRTE
ncbi:MAG: ABC transporter permease [Chitinophagales bacterium]